MGMQLRSSYVGAFCDALLTQLHLNCNLSPIYGHHQLACSPILLLPAPRPQTLNLKPLTLSNRVYDDLSQFSPSQNGLTGSGQPFNQGGQYSEPSYMYSGYGYPYFTPQAYGSGGGPDGEPTDTLYTGLSMPSLWVNLNQQIIAPTGSVLIAGQCGGVRVIELCCVWLMCRRRGGGAFRV